MLALAFSSLAHLPFWEAIELHVKVSVVPLQLIVRSFAITIWLFAFLLPVTVFPTIFAHITNMLDG